MFEERIKKAKEFISENKVKVGAILGLGVLGTFLALRRETTTDDVDGFTDLKVEEELILKDGEWVPLRSEDGWYYSDAFVNDDVRQEFRDMGYKIVDREEA